MKAERIRIRGIVQGVGMRPTIWRLAHECQLRGEVWNDADGVLIEAWGEGESLDHFVSLLKSEAPPLARIEEIERRPFDNATAPDDFRIQHSHDGEARTNVAADATTCPECLAEIVDPSNRRYRYPFTNCTHCGPRLSIIRRIPYDRDNTSMASFPMCPACQAEYDDPTDRRFHAQPNACPVCGPQVWLEDTAGAIIQPQGDEDVIDAAARLLRAGEIVAIKGIGGFHLACDAGNEESVTRLRHNKQRYHKAFALMARDIDMVRRYAEVGADEATLLNDRAAPIVLLQAAGESLAAGIAPGQNSLGFMLPYTPLHHLLMQALDCPIVLTSGNRSDEPQCTDNVDARERLADIAEAWLMHDRDIVNRLDDSVVRIADDAPRVIRRARGYTPQPLLLCPELASQRTVLALGAELKNSFCLLRDRRAVLSQHMGDLEEASTYRDYQHNLKLYRQLFDFSPELIVVDKHPNYLSTQLGKHLAAEEDIPLLEVQHHHAHIAACMAEHGVLPEQRVLGVALDGLGMGENGELWGGEFLLCGYNRCEKLGGFQPVAMPGGAQAMYEPWRNTLAHLLQLPDSEQFIERHGDLKIIRFLQQQPLDTLRKMIDRGLNSPSASSAGRLFDAVAAALGICRERAGFEGHAAIELEAAATPFITMEQENAYGYEWRDNTLSWEPLWRELFTDLQRGVQKGVIAARFHSTIARAVSETAESLAAAHSVEIIALNGGVWQNRLLLAACSHLLRQKGLQVIAPIQVPANDGGISLGQAVIGSLS